MSSYYSSNLRVLIGRLDNDQVDNEDPSSQDFDVRIRNPIITPIIEADDEASKYATGDHGEDEAIMGAQSATIEFSVKMSSVKSEGGRIDGFPAWWKFAQACGCAVETYMDNGNITGYALQPLKSKDVSTMTIFVYDIPAGGGNAVIYKFTGCMGNMTMGAEGVGKPWTATFSFTGKLADIENTDTVPELGITDKTAAEKMLNYELNFHGVGLESDKSQKISTFSLDVGNEISPLIDQADPTGYAYYFVTKRSPRFSCNPLMNGSFNKLFDIWKNDKTFSVLMKSKDEKGFTLYIPKAQPLTVAVASREGLTNWDLNLKALRNDSETTGYQEVTWELVAGKRSGEAKAAAKAAAKKKAKKA